MSYKNILVPLDGSEFAKKALEEAKKLTHDKEARIVLLGVVEFLTAQFEGYAEFVSGLDIHERIRAHMESMLAKDALSLRDQGYKAEHLVREGFPHEEIALACEEEKIDIIVMTTHGRRGFSHWLLGSVAEKVVRSAPCSVLVVRPTAAELAQAEK